MWLTLIRFHPGSHIQLTLVPGNAGTQPGGPLLECPVEVDQGVARGQPEVRSDGRPALCSKTATPGRAACSCKTYGPGSAIARIVWARFGLGSATDLGCKSARFDSMGP